MESRGPLVTSHLLLLLLLLPLLLPSHTHQGWTLEHLLPTQRAQDPPARHLSSGLGQEPVAVMTFDLSKINKTSSSFEFRTWDPEGVIFHGDTNAKDDWFMLGLRDGKPEIQLLNSLAQLTVGAGPRLDDGKWHQVKVKIEGDSVLLWVNGEEILRLRQVSGPLDSKPQSIMRIALGGLLFPTSNLRLPLVPALDGCLRRDTWLGQQAQSSSFPSTTFRSCDVELQPGLFFPPGTHAEFILQGEDSSASFCLDGLWAQGQKLDMDRALSRSQDIWTHSCPQIPSNGTDNAH
ncbi:sex hormone-binding globulin isoform X3 [Urocitellus parryii]|uniref:sex hormone-binding globulin isoform X3 n=1 Tax=Urocitellus parryii TaxID=9999 RepID=UPI000E55BFC5|nr:sex hormone-binding globulin isoform X3 [Urocitellus parryii]